MNLFGGMDSASLEVGQPFVNIRLRPGKIGTVEHLLVKASFLQQYLDSLLDRLETAFRDLGFQPFLGIGFQSYIHLEPHEGKYSKIAAFPKQLYDFIAPNKNSRLPSPPAIGDGMMPTTRQPSETAKAATSSHTAV